MSSNLEQKMEVVWLSMEHVHARMGEDAKTKCKDGTHDLREAIAQEAFRRTKVQIYDWAGLYDEKEAKPGDFEAWMDLYQEAWHELYLTVLREAYEGKLELPNKQAITDLVHRLYPKGEGLLFLNEELTNMRERDKHLKAADESLKKGDYEAVAWNVEAAVDTGYEFLDLIDF